MVTLSLQGVPYGIGVELWPCDPRVSGSIPGGGNLKKRSLCSDDQVDVEPQ